MVTLRVRLDDEGAVVQHERDARPQLGGDTPRGRVAPARDENEADAGAARTRDRPERPAGDLLVAAQQGAVDVEREQPARRGQRPVHASTFSITSPGRTLSATSMPEATHPNTV